VLYNRVSVLEHQSQHTPHTMAKQKGRATFVDAGDKVFRITLDDPQKLKRNWPPSHVPLLMVSVPIFLYPVCVAMAAKYRPEFDNLPEPLAIVLDGGATWILDQVPKITARIFVLHMAACLFYVGCLHLGVIHR
jgi:hypothetical protein